MLAEKIVDVNFPIWNTLSLKLETISNEKEPTGSN